jgi:glycosyltransferase involved in cell wall biosynthesis
VGWPWTEAPRELPLQSGAWPRISIVTPSYKQAAFIEETIRSVLLQGYPNLQFMVIDGGSADGTVAILEKYAPWIDYWASERDRGQSEAINKGLLRSDGVWFNWLNSDDYLYPGALAALAAAGAATSKPIVSGVTRNVGSSKVRGEYSARVGTSWPGLLFNLGVNQPGSLLRLSEVHASGPAREDLALSMDLELWLRLALRHGPDPVQQVGKVVAAYRYHAGSKTCSGSDVFALEECELLTGLAAGLGGLPRGIPGQVTGRPWERIGTPSGVEPAADDVSRELLGRLVVADSLLFRALVLAFPDGADARAGFSAALGILRPELRRLFPGERPDAMEARALISALQSLGRLDRRMALRALALRPTPGTLMDLLRLLCHSRVERR